MATPRSVSFAAAVAIGALILLVPAVLSGRPFIFYDTWVFYMWGHDVIAALGHPWPVHGAFPAGRNLWASEVVSALPAVVDETQFRLTLSAIGSRSAFYAVPVALLRWVWLAAAAQALVVSACLEVLTRAAGLRRPAFLAIMAALTAATTLPFFTAFIMPDVFTALAIVAAGTLFFFPHALSRIATWSLSALIAYAVTAHTSNLLVVAAAVVVGALLIAWTTTIREGLRRAIPGGAALLAGVAMTMAGGQVLAQEFGHPIRNPPFLLARVLVDGPGLAYLEQVCPDAGYVSCELVDRQREQKLYSEGFMWPHVGIFPFSPRHDPARREQFYAEQWRIVLGTIEHDPIGQASASAKNALWQLVMFKVRPEMNDALVDVLRLPLRRAGITASLTPNVDACLAGDGQGCNLTVRGWMWRYLQLWQHAVVALASLLIAYRLLPGLASGFRQPALSRDQLFALFACCLVVTNAVVCGVLSGPYNRYQARVVWLIPLASMLLESCGGVLARVEIFRPVPGREPRAPDDSGRRTGGDVHPRLLA